MFELDCDLRLQNKEAEASFRVHISSGPGVWSITLKETTRDPARAAECHESLMKLVDDLVAKGYKLRGRRTRPLSGS